MLLARSLIVNIKGKSIFNTFKDYFKEKNIPLANIMSITTDRLLQWWVDIALLKRKVPDVLAVHCMIHRKHLVGENLSNRLHQSLQYAISAVNKIHCNALYD
ncbi:protein FAM200C-like [Parasteatoda tepidariorum]|uniref:protein FAM200C-like n=1 Tax=Parasteatoda tepidariorum TaxID=114398 RepID=UPI0039BCFC34